MNNADEISQSEKRRVLANDRQVMAERQRVSTYRDAAQASVDDMAGGRYAVIDKPSVTGTSPITYPRQSATSPSNQATLVCDEPPLGVDVNAMEPVGEPHEIVEAEQVLARRKG